MKALLGMFVVAALFASAPARAEEDLEERAPVEEGCWRPDLCHRLPPPTPEAEPYRSRLLLVSALLPFGGVWVPRYFIDREVRPSLEGELQETLILHALLPAVACVTAPIGGACAGGLLGGGLTGGGLAVVWGLFLGVIGAVVLPIGGGPCLATLGGAVGALFGVVAGGFWTTVLGFVLGIPLGALVALPGQFYFGPVNSVRAWERAMRERPRTEEKTPRAVDDPDDAPAVTP